jgi:hypothetical protein
VRGAAEAYTCTEVAEASIHRALIRRYFRWTRLLWIRRPTGLRGGMWDGGWGDENKGNGFSHSDTVRFFFLVLLIFLHLNLCLQSLYSMRRPYQLYWASSFQVFGSCCGSWRKTRVVYSRNLPINQKKNPAAVEEEWGTFLSSSSPQNHYLFSIHRTDTYSQFGSIFSSLDAIRLSLGHSIAPRIFLSSGPSLLYPFSFLLGLLPSPHIHCFASVC